MKVFFAGSNFHGVGRDGRIQRKTGIEKELEVVSLIQEVDGGDYNRLVSLFYKDDVRDALEAKEIVNVKKKKSRSEGRSQ